MLLSYEEQRELNLKHALDPQKGDYWEDHMVGVLQVIDVIHGLVIFFDQKKEVDANHWEWDTTKPRSLTTEDFSTYLRYKSEGMKDKTWARVHPGQEL